MTTTPHLLQMPDVAMNIILKKSDFRSILVLRKVCRDLRNFIDDQSPESHLEHVSVSIDLESIYLRMQFNGIIVKYEKRDDGCYIASRQNPFHKEQSIEKLMRGMDYLSLFLDDFKVIMCNQKTPLWSLKVYISERNSEEWSNPWKLLNKQQLLENIDAKFLETRDALRASESEKEDVLMAKLLTTVDQSLKFWGRPTPTKWIEVGAVNQQQVMTVLQNLDARFLESMDIQRTSYDESLQLEMDQIFELELWKDLKFLKINGLVPNMSLEKFTQFKQVSMPWNSVTEENVLELKEMFLNCPHMDKFTLRTKDIDPNQFHLLLGQSFGEQGFLEPPIYAWYFEIPDSKKLLKFVVCGEHEDWAFLVERVLGKKWNRV